MTTSRCTMPGAWSSPNALRMSGSISSGVRLHFIETTKLTKNAYVECWTQPVIQTVAQARRVNSIIYNDIHGRVLC
jgi:hypothetical protein